MIVEPFGLVIFALGGLALMRGPGATFALFIVATLFGSAAALILGGGQTTIQPAHLMLGFVALSMASQRGRYSAIIENFAFPRAGFWLACTLVYGVASAILAPRLLAGVTHVNTIGVTQFGPVLIETPLGPTSGNITQSIYLTADLICFTLVRAFAQTAPGMRLVLNALIAYCCGDVLFAALDLVTYWTNTAAALEFMRNATYQLHNDTEVEGLKRIVGSFTETSAFAYATLGVVGFTGRLWIGGFRARLTGIIAAASFMLLIFSTSSTAYGALPLLSAILFLVAARLVWRGRAGRNAAVFTIAAPLAILLAALAIRLHPAAWNSVHDYVDLLLFDKSASQSGIERGRWNTTAIRNFIETFGLGAGVGSVRASSFPIAVLANLGVVGATAYSLFLAHVLTGAQDGDPHAALLRAAARMGCIGLLSAAILSGTLVDLGLPFFIMAGLATASPERAVAVRGLAHASA